MLHAGVDGVRQPLASQGGDYVLGGGQGHGGTGFQGGGGAMGGQHHVYFN